MPSQFRWPRWSLVVLLAVCSCTAAQETKESGFLIKVKDVSEAGVSDAEVHFVERSSSGEKVQITDGAGTAAVEVKAGNYRLTVTRSGFKSWLMPDVELRSGEYREIVVILAIEECPRGNCGDAQPVALEPERTSLDDRTIKDAETPVQAKTAFCEVVRNPERFNGKEVTIRATYKYGFEWQQLYCLDCLDRGKAWLEIPNELDDASQKALTRAPKGAGTVNLTLEGVFESGSTYGHQNGYRYQFVAHRISNVVVVIKGMKAPAVEQEAEKQWACGGVHPK